MHALSILSILMVFFSSCSSCSEGQPSVQTAQVVQAEPVIEEYNIEEPTETEYKGQNVKDDIITPQKNPVIQGKSVQTDVVKKITITEEQIAEPIAYIEASSIDLPTNESEKIPEMISFISEELLVATALPVKESVVELPKKTILRESLTTFASYRPSHNVTSDIFQWYSKDPQKEYKVSLVGVNINTWLETPDYFTVLKDTAKKFSVRALLDNLASNNPNFIFNDPTVVSRALKEDIYTPYMQVLSNYKRPLQFADISEVVSYTRNYHIYGVAAGGLPYFGRPVEGGSNRELNLGLLRGQMDEVVAKLPDTDIYLVAMLNIIPNWLEEWLDINHVPQQQVEILVYAFDKKGKLLGGGGLPSTIRDSGNTYYIEQKYISDFWQTGISRGFYILPSYRILNTKDYTKEKRMPTVQFPTDIRPTLDGNQRYVLSALTYLKNSGKKVNVELFSPDGKKLINIEKIKIDKVELENRKLIHENKLQKIEQKILEKKLSEQQKAQDELQGLKPILEEEATIDVEYVGEVESHTLAYHDVSAKFNNFDEMEKQRQKALKQAYIPSNEGDKIKDILNSVEKTLTRPLFTHTNYLYHTNEILPYELEVDPVEYNIEQKKYAIIPHNVNQFKKEYKQDTKILVRHCKTFLSDRVFWQDYRFGFIKEHLKEVKLLEKEDTTQKIDFKSEDTKIQDDAALSKEEIAELKLRQKEAERLEKERLLSEDVEYLYNEWKKSYTKYTKIKLKKLEIERNINMYVELQKSLLTLHSRNNALIEHKYSGKDKKIATMKQKVVLKVEKIETEIQNHVHDTQEKLSNINREMTNAELEEGRKYTAFIAKMPDISRFLESDSSMNIDEPILFSKVDKRVIANGIAEGKKSPLMKEGEKLEKKNDKELKRLLRNLSYEGYMLGITKSWQMRTGLEDRLVEL